jgi:hypothetical protein
MAFAPVAAAQERSESTPDDGSPADVELSLSISPSLALFGAASQLGGAGALGGLGGTGALGGLGVVFSPVLDVGIAIDPSVLFVVGASGAFSDAPGTSFGVTVPFGFLWYLEPPRVGRAMPMLRTMASVGYSRAEIAPGNDAESYAIGLLARGGLTWLPCRELGLRAEIGLHGTGSRSSFAGEARFAIGVGMDALIGLVMRLG